MRILFLGTGAADWENPGKHVNGGRRFTSQLLEESILLDCGPMTWEAIKEFGVDINKLTDIVIGHPHGDHFNVDVIAKIATERDKSLPPLRLHVNKKATERVNLSPEAAARLQVIGFEPGDVFECNGYAFEAFLSNHLLEIEGELATFLFITTPSGERLFYALDGSWLPKEAWWRLRKMDTPFDYIIWDMTCGTLDDWRLFEHCNLNMIATMTRVFKNYNVAKKDAVVFASHVMKAACGDMDRLRAAVKAEGIVLAEDGLIYDSNSK